MASIKPDSDKWICPNPECACLNPRSYSLCIFCRKGKLIEADRIAAKEKQEEKQRKLTQFKLELRPRRRTNAQLGK